MEVANDLGAIWLIFGESYINENAETRPPDHREKVIVDLLYSCLGKELVSPGYDPPILTKLATIHKLLQLWSEDLDLIYQLRDYKDEDNDDIEDDDVENDEDDSKVKCLAQRFLQRIQNFDNLTIIPNGLISSLRPHKGSRPFESVSLAIIQKQGRCVNWIQVDPGSAYHQHCRHLVGEKSNAYLAITGINPENITEDLLYLLVGLKATRPDGPYYEDLSLYECVLSQLNGKTAFQSEADEGFIQYSHSPTHTWLVIDKSLCWLLRNLFGDTYLAIYNRLLVNFKLFLMKKVLAVFQEKVSTQPTECRFLLQEMCRDVAQQALDLGSKEQKEISFQLISKVKAVIEDHWSKQEELVSQLDELHVSSLSFVAPTRVDLNPSSGNFASSNVLVLPIFRIPTNEDDIIDYLQNLKTTFINKLLIAKDISSIVLLSCGIEVFLINYLANTNILDKSISVCYSKNDALLAEFLSDLAQIYCGCQTKLVKNFLSKLTYEPMLYAKNVTIQFFVYAAITALNRRDPKIGPILASYNLCVAFGGSITLRNIIPHLVIEDSHWVKVLLDVQAFFMPVAGREMLFSHFSVKLENNANETHSDVSFAYKLLRKDQPAYERFIDKQRNIGDEKLSYTWANLTYTDTYLPSMYHVLSEVANLAKMSLTGFPPIRKQLEISNCIKIEWYISTKRVEFQFDGTRVKFRVNNYAVSNKVQLSDIPSFVLESSSYQIFLFSKLENEIIATQDNKPDTMGFNRYLQLAFLQSEPEIKLERLYIALKEKQIDFSVEEEGVLIKQTLFKISILKNEDGNNCSLLEWTAHLKPQLINAFGLLCIEKAKAMQYRLTQHHAIGDILLITLGLLTFYPTEYKPNFIDSIMAIFHMLKETLTQPAAHLSDSTLLHLNAYLLIAVRAKPQVLETETLTILKALVAIQNFKIKGSKLNNSWLLQVHAATFQWCSWVELQLEKDPTLLNNLMLSVNPEWDATSSWTKSEIGLLFTCNNHEIEPLRGSIYFQEQQIRGLPDEIKEDRVFKECLGDETFLVVPSSCTIHNTEVTCYLSIERTPQLRLTPLENSLLIEEKIGDHYLRYILAEELLDPGNYSRLLYETPCNNEKLQHWLDKDKNILIKDKRGEIIFKWDFTNNFLFSLKQEGYLVPWEHLRDSVFKTRLEHIELSVWIELIAKPLFVTSYFQIQALNFPRLCLNFNYKDGQFFSKQVHGYVIAQQQYLNTLHGFSSYVVLKMEEQNSVEERIKVIIPHRRVISKGPFYVKTTTVDHKDIRTPAYFVYDYDSKMSLLKGHSIRAQLYLALIYFRSASLDDHDASQCNAYHLARENLELCWKDQPYDKVELDIIEQLLDVSAMRCLHSHGVALFLKVVSLVSNSLRLAFLFQDKVSQENKERSGQLLNNCNRQSSDLLAVYLRNKKNIFARIRLTAEEEKDAVKHCSVSFLNSEKKCYNTHYREFFSEHALTSTDFIGIFKKYMHLLHFSHGVSEIDFSAGIDRIMHDQFQLVQFISLYKLAKASSITSTKYRYLLHHLLIKFEEEFSNFPAQLVNMLARTLFLVAEDPDSFPHVPIWFDKTVNLSERQLVKDEVFKKFPTFCWKQNFDQGCSKENVVTIRNEEAEKDQKENQQIWSLLTTHDLDSEKVPRCLPAHPSKFTLLCENYIDSMNMDRLNDKLKVVKESYVQAAYNDSFYQFFVRVLEECDKRKHNSKTGWKVAPFIYKTITVTLTAVEKMLPNVEPVSRVNYTLPNQPQINLDNFFSVIRRTAENSDFIFESQAEEYNAGYQHQFYQELEESWIAYNNEQKFSYKCCTSDSIDRLEATLQMKYNEIHCQAKQIWNQIEAQFKLRTNTESNEYFALRWYSGQVRYYHKRDILRLLIEPHNLLDYNADCNQYYDCIIQELLEYLTLEIHSSKMVRVLELIKQYKVTAKSEQFSILQCLVSSLKEEVDHESYRYPHWLLFQYENEIIVRDNQRELIIAMLSQTEKAMYQLNMGEGKSSVILPLLSYSLANGQQLVRINVLSPLLTTMKEFLRQRFSGLIRKRVYTLPFNRDLEISTQHLTAILETLETCQHSQHFLVVTPEHRMCAQLKIREFMLENRQQIGATDIFNWDTYRQRVQGNTELYQDLSEEEKKRILKEQDEFVKTNLRRKKYINRNNQIISIPPREQGFKEFAKLKDSNTNSEFKEWSCLKAAYCELLYNSTIAQKDSSEKLAVLKKIIALTAIDLLDESDEILKHGSELNYTMGDKYVFSGGKLRWQIPQFFIEAIFCDSNIRNIITAGKKDGFTRINLDFHPQGGVPFVQFLNESYFNDYIKPLLIEKFFQTHFHSLQKHQCNADNPLIEGEPSCLREYIAGKLPLSTEKKMIGVLTGKGSLKDKILIAKGWLSHGILFHVFNAKYRVQYGLNLNAQGEVLKQIAIPFLGKDVPSPRSEFSHPDVMLGLTIISYLYQGLDVMQLKKTILKLKSDSCYIVADSCLSRWTEAGQTYIEQQTQEFPPLLLTSVQNLDVADQQCLEKIHRYLSGNYMTIFFYLNQFVLLEEAMQYHYKISADAHSLVGYNAALGFSGTDDRKITMPFQIKSLRSKTQEGTNGKLLSVLTQKRNSRYHPLESEDTVVLLEKFCDYARTNPDCQVLIDAGALITGLSNYAVAEYLLAHLPSDFLGILYFSDDANSLTVLTRDMKNTILQDCYLDRKSLFIYLDDVHTRGTDLKLNWNCHAILTIGMGMEKDKLVQAAMRLRQLAEKQSVSLWGTQTVTLAIVRDNGIDAASINSFEVIKWVTQNTIENINSDLFPVAVKRINFQFLKKAETLLEKSPIPLDTLVKYCQEKELFLLDDFFALSPQSEDLASRLYCFVFTRERTFWLELENELKSKNCSKTDFYKEVSSQQKKEVFRDLLLSVCKEVTPYLRSGFVHDSLNNDEEKEIEVEVIRKQEEEIVPKVRNREEVLENLWNAKSILQSNFITFATENKIIMPLHEIKRFIQNPDLNQISWHSDIYMTYNFINSVEPISNERLDNYLRPIDVILMHRYNGKSAAVLLSGREASRIKSTCNETFGSNLLIHINDEIDGPTQLPVGSSVSKVEQKLLTIIKLFSGECNYFSLKEVQRVAKRVGRLYPQFFACADVSIDFSKQLFEILIEGGYLDFAGVMTEKLIKILQRIEPDDFTSLRLPARYEPHNQFLLKKLHGIFTKLIISASNSLKDSHNILCQWVETRGRLTEYSGSALESILDSENELKCSQ